MQIMKQSVQRLLRRHTTDRSGPRKQGLPAGISILRNILQIIGQLQENRGIEMSGKASLVSRLKSMSNIIFPLIFSSMDRIDVVSNAMELRGFGKNKTRTWYSGKPLKRNDYLTLIFVGVFCIGALVITFADGSRFYNPF